jgi:hypothetical protein
MVKNGRMGEIDRLDGEPLKTFITAPRIMDLEPLPVRGHQQRSLGRLSRPTSPRKNMSVHPVPFYL